MVRFISLLRGINVASKNSLSMTDVQKLYESLGFTRVKTYLQTGNVIFESSRNNQKKIAQTISDGLRDSFHMQVKVVVLTKEEFTSYIDANPFKHKDSSHVYFTILFDTPQAIFIDYLNKFKDKSEEFVIKGRVVYLYCPNGYGKTKLSTSFFEQKLNTSATTRNSNTMHEIVELL